MELLRSFIRKKTVNEDRKLESKHIDFLTNKETLQAWSGRTLIERCILFHRSFVDKKISKTKLWKTYKDHGIKNKVVKYTKFQPSQHAAKYEGERRLARYGLKFAFKKKMKVLFLDEVNFTKHSNQRKTFSAKYENILIDQKEAFTKFMAVISTISLEKGVDYYEVHDNPIDATRFHNFLRNLRKANGDTSLCCFLDNLGVHRMNLTRQLCEELDIFLVFNESYSPETNPIESVFSVLKRHY